MNITVTGRHIEITPEIEDHARTGVGKLKRFFDGIIDAQIILSTEKRSKRAEISILADGIHLHGESTTGDLYKSMDTALARIQTQVTKYKEKLKNHRLRRKDQSPPKGLGLQVDTLHREEVELGESQPQIIRTRNYDLKPMSIDEAVMQMDLIHRDVLVFMNSDTTKLNVICRHKDGNYELIAPNI